MAHKAMRGGEIGANGEFYKGGQFVADCPNTAKGRNANTSRTHKIEIEPYKWIAANHEEKSIMRAVVGTVASWVGERGGVIALRDDAAEICARNGWNFEAARDLVARYNAGERIYAGRGIY